MYFILFLFETYSIHKECRHKGFGQDNCFILALSTRLILSNARLPFETDVVKCEMSINFIDILTLELSANIKG